MKVESGQISANDQLLEIEKMVKEINDQRIKLEDFRGDVNFSNDEIDRDIQACEQKEASILQEKQMWPPEMVENYKRSQAAEYAFRHALKDHEWLGKNTALIVTSQFDDYFRGIDTVAEISAEANDKTKAQHIGLAIDFSIAPESVGNKIRITFDSLDRGYCPSIKYFKSETTGKCRNLRVPRVVIGASGESLQRLINFSEEIIDNSGVAESSVHELSNDPFQFIFFGELLSQLGTYCARLENVIKEAGSNNRPDVENRARETLQIHKDSFDTVFRIMASRNITMQMIQKHMRGDQFASKMGSALSILSKVPVTFDNKN